MAYITTDNNYTPVLCSKCGQEVKVDISTVISDGINNWYIYQCQHCGHIGDVKIEPVKEDTQIIDLDSLKRISDSLDEIKELLKEVLKDDK